MLKNFFLSEKKLLKQFKRRLSHEKSLFLMKWTVFCNAEQIFYEFELFEEKVILELKMHKITSL